MNDTRRTASVKARHHIANPIRDCSVALRTRTGASASAAFFGAAAADLNMMPTRRTPRGRPRNRRQRARARSTSARAEVERRGFRRDAQAGREAAASTDWTFRGSIGECSDATPRPAVRSWTTTTLLAPPTHIHQLHPEGSTYSCARYSRLAPPAPPPPPLGAGAAIDPVPRNLPSMCRIAAASASRSTYPSPSTASNTRTTLSSPPATILL